MDELIRAIEARTGLPADKGERGGRGCHRLPQEKPPDPIASQIDGFLEGNADNIANTLGGATDKLKGMFGD